MSHPYPAWMNPHTARSTGFLYLDYARRCFTKGDRANYRRYLFVAARWFQRAREGLGSVHGGREGIQRGQL